MYPSIILGVGCALEHWVAVCGGNWHTDIRQQLRVDRRIVRNWNFSEVAHALELSVVAVVLGRSGCEHFQVVTTIALMTDQMSAH